MGFRPAHLAAQHRFCGVASGKAGGGCGFDCFRARSNPELRQEIGDMPLSGTNADEEQFGNLAIGLTGDEEAENLFFPRR